MRKRRNPGPKGAAKRRALAHAYGRAVHSRTIDDAPGGRLSNLQKAYIRRRIVDARRASRATTKNPLPKFLHGSRDERAGGPYFLHGPRRVRRRRPRSPAQIAATRRMIAGLRRSKARRRRNPAAALLAGLNSANPGRVRRRKPQRKARTMARRRRSAAQRAAFKKMLAGLRRSKSKGRHRRRNPKKKGSAMARKHRRRRSARVVMMNPRRRRRPARGRRRRSSGLRRRVTRHRRRNPGGGGFKATLRQIFGVAVPAVVAGGASGFIDSKLLSSKPLYVRILAKLAEAFGVSMLLRSRPQAASAAMGAILGSIGYEQGVAMAGGVIAGASPAAKAAGVQALITEDPRAMGVLVKAMGAAGYQLDNNVSLGAGSSLDSALPPNSFVDVNLG